MKTKSDIRVAAKAKVANARKAVFQRNKAKAASSQANITYDGRGFVPGPVVKKSAHSKTIKPITKTEAHTVADVITPDIA